MNIDLYNKVTDRIKPKEKCREEVLNMSKMENKIKHRINKRIVVIVAVAAAVTCGGMSVFALRYTNVFDNLISKKERTYIAEDGQEHSIDKFDIVDYEPISKHAKVLDEPILNKSDDISVAIDSIYCDGSNLTLAITAAFNDGNADKLNVVNFDTTLVIGNNSYSTLNRAYANYTWLDGNLILDENTENSFTGSINLTLRNGEKITEDSKAKLILSNMACYDTEQYQLIQKKFEDVSIDFDLTPDLSIVKESAYTIEEDGYVVNIHEITPAKITCTTDYPFARDSGIVVLCFDESGNEIPYLNTDDNKNGLPVGLLTGTESSTIKFKFVDKNDGLRCLKELTVDFSNIELD